MRHAALILVLAGALLLAGCSGMGNSQVGAGNGAGGNIGLAAGGAQDAEAFRTNVEEGYVPQPTDLPYEGLYHDYYFETGQQQPCEQLFCPSYSRAVTTDPLSNETERYLAVGLNSGIAKEDFERKPLNLVVVVDTSSSMDSPFDRYYYDDGQRRTVSDETSKMQAARESVTAMLDQLRPGDRVGVVSFSDDSEVVQDVTAVDELDMDSLDARVGGLQAGGGTNLAAGMETANDQLEPYRDSDNTERETRIIYVTDAMPNRGMTDGQSLDDSLGSDAEAGVYSTFVGVGVDYNSRLVDTITDVEGANYYSVDSPDGFRERMSDGFQYMVTPLVFDLSLSVEASGYEVANVYGAPGDDNRSDELMSVTTLFPSRTEDNRTEGGVILLRLEPQEGDGQIRLQARYRDRAGTQHKTERVVDFGGNSAPHYDSTGVRKAVALTRYASLMRHWAAHERALDAGESVETPADGIAHDDPGTWEQQSVPLRVSEPYGERIERFTAYFRAEMQRLNASRMQQDLRVLDQLRTNATETTIPSTARRINTTAET